jgi:hypothetical protein
MRAASQPTPGTSFRSGIELRGRTDKRSADRTDRTDRAIAESALDPEVCTVCLGSHPGCVPAVGRAGRDPRGEVQRVMGRRRHDHRGYELGCRDADGLGLSAHRELDGRAIFTLREAWNYQGLVYSQGSVVA